MGVDLGHAAGPDSLLDPLGEHGQRVLADRATLAGLADADEHLLPTERLRRPSSA